MFIRRIVGLFALVLLLLLTSCARTSHDPTPAPIVSVAPTATAPSLSAAVTAISQDERESALFLKTWIDAVTSGDAELARYVYRVGGMGAHAEIAHQIETMREFVGWAEDPANTPFGRYQGFHEIVGSYAEPDANQRTAIALMRFERATVCFRAAMARQEALQLWSVEQWAPLFSWSDCVPEVQRMPTWVQEEWREVLPTTVPPA
ncbi:hypothetical protein [Candidatus Viridilinea mediisalina]|uniref:Uncharacterized protein n=1 Tax=Candidatus Viridilinea mediisalina TaxID=2024553 RepID=A0A2A6RKV2_9CHLR|nr:hypothetical protein [Candidatus Viridilinea mediisalina]PDW03498.1 hypothetical protein CJ255_08425 [Candidatus Viridilinea mediisalina]